MKRALLVTLIAALSAVGFAQAKGPTTKQNGSEPVISAFTSICAVSGYANYGFCGGDATRFTNVGGKMNAVQPKAGKYNLDFSFTNLTPGVEYRLWATREGGMPDARSIRRLAGCSPTKTGSLQFKFRRSLRKGSAST